MLWIITYTWYDNVNIKMTLRTKEQYIALVNLTNLYHSIIVNLIKTYHFSIMISYSHKDNFLFEITSHFYSLLTLLNIAPDLTSCFWGLLMENSPILPEKNTPVPSQEPGKSQTNTSIICTCKNTWSRVDRWCLFFIIQFFPRTVTLKMFICANQEQILCF